TASLSSRTVSRAVSVTLTRAAELGRGQAGSFTLLSGLTGPCERGSWSGGRLACPSDDGQPTILPPVDRDALERFAHLAVDFSANVQPGQIVTIEAETGMEPVVRAVAERAYQRGARFVDATYFDPYIKKARLQLAPEETLEFVPEWYGKRMLQLGDVHAARIVLVPR